MIFDIETDGLNATKIHVLSWMGDDGEVRSTNDYQVMRDLIEQAEAVGVLEQYASIPLVGGKLARDTVAKLKGDGE